MEEILTYKKRSKLFIAVAFIVPYLLSFLQNAVNLFLSDNFAEVELRDVLSSVLSFAVSLITVALFFLLGKALTKSNTKAIIFTAVLCFTQSLTGIITDLITTVATSLSYTGIITPPTISTVTLVAEFVFLPVKIILAYSFFTTLEGINEKFQLQGIGSFKTTLSAARKRYFIYFVISFVIPLIFSSSVAFVISATYTGVDNSNVVAIVSQLSNYLAKLLPFIALYIIGYKPYKSHPEAIAFSSGIILANRISGIAFSLPILGVTQLLIETENYSMLILPTILSVVLSLLNSIASILLVMWLFKFFFSNETAEEPYSQSAEEREGVFEAADFEKEINNIEE